jgi:hypothetical protein
MHTLSLDPTRVVSRLFVAIQLISLIAMSACGGCQNTTTTEDMGRADMTSDADMTPAPEDMPETTPDLPDEEDMTPDLPKICEPGEVVDCREENSPAVDICNADGTGTDPGSCPANQVCRGGSCVAVNCIPGARRCSGDIPQECDEMGYGFVDQDECQGGARCEEGFCLDRCELARRNKSYIGCEYWAVELENHLLYDNEIDDDLMPPFGIVLANTSDTYDAQITVYDDSGVIAEAVGERVVGLDRPDPEVIYETVYSEVVDAQGNVLQRLDGPVDRLVLPRGALMTLIMPHKRIPFGQSTIGKFGYKVESTQPIVAYQFNPLCCNYNTTNDASLLLPESALTQDYMFLGYAVFAGSTGARLEDPWSATLTVVATEPDTEVTINLRPPKGENRPYSELIYASSDARLVGPDEQGVIRATLQPFEVLNLGGTGAAPVEDLTGTRISATAPVAVFSGHSCAYVPYTLGFCDHIESQLFPLETWGRRFVLTPLKLRNEMAAQQNTREATYFKFVARQDDTRILTGIDIAHKPGGTLRPADEGVPSCADYSSEPESGLIELNAGETCEFGTRKLFVAQSNHPISIGAFISGQDSVREDASPGDRAGDPAFFFIPPEEQYRTSYSILTPKTYFQNYVTVSIQPGFGVALNGEMLDLTQFDYEENLDEGIVRAHIPLEEGPHRLEAQVPFGIVVYGYDDYVSYAYTGGLNLTKLSELP